MTSFTWVGAEDLAGRYAGVAEDMAGLPAWRTFVRTVFDEPRDALTKLIEDLGRLPDRSLAHPRVFVSHRRADVDYAERIAWLAARKAGLDYWLDVHDPVLVYATTAIPATYWLYPYLIAGIIEMALLNCSHVIAAHTPPRPGGGPWIPSQWIPYEFGRAKSRSVYSTRAAGWFHPCVRPPESRGEYVLLADVLAPPLPMPAGESDQEVKHWLRRQGYPRHPKKRYLGTGVPQALPDLC
jgi:hypothetical protein